MNCAATAGTRPIGFDNERYLAEQSEAIRRRVEWIDGRLYLEFGGKLLFDYHAARVLPGFDPNVKIRLLHRLRDQAAILLCVYAGDIERRKMRADFGITYDVDTMKLIDDLRRWDLHLLGVVVTRYEGQPAVRVFMNKLQRRGIAVYTHRPTHGYPVDVDLVVSPEGYGANPFIESDKPLVVVTGPGPGSGKLATCLSQLYHDFQSGRSAEYAKFETFPIWNLPLQHPVNLAYEAATADLGDINMIDPHHLEAAGETAVSYNRDVEAFPLLLRLLMKITGRDAPYRSPTEMGVNRAGFAIIDDALVRAAACQEIIRRHFRYHCEHMLGVTHSEAFERTERLMQGLGLSPEDRPVVEPARAAAREASRQADKGHDGIFCGAALQLPDGTLITGKNSQLLHAASSVVLNAAKYLAGIPDNIHLLSPHITESVGAFKERVLNDRSVSLNLDETLIALSIGAATNPSAAVSLEQLTLLRGCEMHMTHMPPPGDEGGLRKLEINLTSDPQFVSRDLFDE